MHRRGFITGLGALIAAPAIVRIGSLMPVRGIIMPVEKYGVWQGAAALDDVKKLNLIRRQWLELWDENPFHPPILRMT